MRASELKELFDTYKTDLTRIVRESEEAVTEWRWATDLMISFEPLHDIVKRQCRYWRLQDRHWVAREEDGGFDATLHGFDRNGMLRMWRYRNAPGHYLVHGTSEVDELWERQSLDVTRYCLNDGATTIKYFASCYGCIEERFERIGTRYTSSTIRRCSFQDNSFEDSADIERRTFVYGESGDLDRVVHYSSTGPEHWRWNLLFVRPRGETLSATLDELEELLATQIPESIRLRPPSEPVYCLAIVYCGEDFVWPTTMWLGTESLRNRLLAEEDPQWRHKALVPGEWGTRTAELPLWSPSAHERAIELQLRAFQLLDAPNIWLEGEALRPARALLQRVAARLMQCDWNSIMPVTDDFIAYVIDDTGDFDAAEDIRASVPANRIALLREQGYLWI